MESLSKLVLSGAPRDRGVRHGERFADEIAENIGIYLDYFAAYGVDEDTAREQANEFIPIIRDGNEPYFEEMEGVAEGSSLPLEEVTIVNVRHTIIYSAFSNADAGELDSSAVKTVTDGCTSFGVRPERSATGHTVIGQNWDWLQPINSFIMDARPDEAPNLLALTEAGMVGGKFGLNEHGIGYVVNGLTTPDDGKYLDRKPSHVRGREILAADRLEGAIKPIIEGKRPCSRNYLLGHAAGEIVDIETGPDAVSYHYPEEGVLSHANHFEDRSTFDSKFEQIVPHTVCRGMRIRRLLSKMDPVDEANLKEMLRDHFDAPTGICNHGDPDDEHPSHTKASVIMDLNDREMIAAVGPPCEHEYEHISVAG